MNRRLYQTSADYAVIAVCPTLIILMLTALVHFLVLCMYQGDYTSRLMYIFFLFIVATTLIARIAIEQGRAYAFGYAVALGLATFIAINRFVVLSGPLAGLSFIFNTILIVLIWWIADRITFDCTVIDDSVNSAGEGLLNSSGLFGGASSRQKELAKNPTPNTELDGTSTSDQDSQADSRALPRKRRGHQPGRWVLYLALAALPMFGIGQLFLPGFDTVRSGALRSLGIYLFATLALLVTTSFLGVRRYLRQRGTEMPNEVSVAWLAGGIFLTAAILVLCFILPLPGRMIAQMELPKWLVSPDGLKASRFGWGNEAAEKGTGNEPSTNSSTRQQSGSQQSGSQQSGSQQSGSQQSGSQQSGSQQSGSQQSGSQQSGSQQSGSQQSGSQQSGSQQSGSQQSGSQQSGSQQSGSQQSGSQQSGSQQSGSQQSGSQQSGSQQSGSQQSGSQQSGSQQSGSQQSGSQQSGSQQSGSQQSGSQQSGSQQSGSQQSGSQQSGSQQSGSQQSGSQQSGSQQSGSQQSGSQQSGSQQSGSQQSGSQQSGSQQSGSQQSGSQQSGSQQSGSQQSGSQQSGSQQSGSQQSGSQQSGSQQSDTTDKPKQQNENQSETSGRNDGSQQSGNSTPPKPSPSNSMGWLSNLASWIPSIFRWIVIAVLLFIIVLFVSKNLDALRQWLRSLLDFLKGEDKPVVEQAAAVQELLKKPQRSFSSFRNPISEGIEPSAAIIVSFQAYEAWGRERGYPRHEEETPSEYVGRTGTLLGTAANSVEQVTVLYNRIVYGNTPATAKDLTPVAPLWKAMSTQIQREIAPPLAASASTFRDTSGSSTSGGA
jgi:hypothetical protein